MREFSRREVVRIHFSKASSATMLHHELRLDCRSVKGLRFQVVFRAYNDALAFRYEVPSQPGIDQAVVLDEESTFVPEAGSTAYVQYLENDQTSHEHQVEKVSAGRIRPHTLLDLPATFVRYDGLTFAITEGALRKYAGMSLMRMGAGTELTAKLTPRADGVKVSRTLPMEAPWRVILVGDHPGALIESHVLYALNDPPAFQDLSWIKPGKMTWPWWNGHLFESKPTDPILSIQTVKRYIDFCAENGIAFHSVVSDEHDRPWYVQKVDGLFPGPGTDVTKVRSDLDLGEIQTYARSKGVRLWTWVHQGTLRGRVEEAFAAFEKLGWAGMMVDFFDHDDQETVEFAEAILQAAARHHILIHFHGIWKPSGWQRTYPNLMNHEGVLNLEYLKWGDACTPEHDLRIAFTRHLAGPIDYHLGGFRAVPRREFKAQNQAPMVLGTRAHQLAMYVIWDNPNPMVADYPAAYAGQPGFDFIREVPTWWDETRVVAAQVGKVLVVARRKGKDWWLGGMSAGSGFTLEVPTTFLGKGTFRGELWTDGPSSAQMPNQLDHDTVKQPVSAKNPISIRFGVDGGFVARLTS